MAAKDLTVREMTGGHALAWVGPFVAVEAIVAATTRVPLDTSSDAGDPPQPMPGRIVGYSISCEAGSNFTVQATLNGTPDTGVTITVNAAKEVAMFKPADYIDFVAEDTIGMKFIADTTSKDFVGFLLVAYDTTGF